METILEPEPLELEPLEPESVELEPSELEWEVEMEWGSEQSGTTQWKT